MSLIKVINWDQVLASSIILENEIVEIFFSIHDVISNFSFPLPTPLEIQSHLKEKANNLPSAFLLFRIFFEKNLPFDLRIFFENNSGNLPQVPRFIGLISKASGLAWKADKGNVQYRFKGLLETIKRKEPIKFIFMDKNGRSYDSSKGDDIYALHEHTPASEAFSF